jgi:hypothetical protein
MNDAEWLTCAEPRLMLEHLHASSKPGERKLRLFAIGYCRLVQHLLAPWVEMVSAVDAAARYVEGQLTLARLGQIGAALARYYPHLLRPGTVGEQAHAACRLAASLVAADPWAGPWEVVRNPAWEADRQRQASMLRCVFGNPFRPIPVVERGWLVWDNALIPNLAGAIYREAAFDRLPILADALEDAGCDHSDILGHCRRPGEHARGCWVVELLLHRG